MTFERKTLYPTLGLSHGLIQEADWAGALAKAYTSWLHDTILKADPRLKGVAILPIQKPTEAEEVRGFVDRKDSPADLSRKILWDNPKRLYGI